MWMIADPAFTDRANYPIWAAYNLERLADRVTNICEVQYTDTDGWA